ncbi:MAG: hypothetical protein IJ225_08700 [Solobacterium sp.]|nr:hypothetical protein [Solobacterium sp.]
MKQYLKLFLAGIMAAVLLACGNNTTASQEPTVAPGDYQLNELIDERGASLAEDLAVLQSLDQIVTIHLAEDGTGVLYMFDESSSLTWTESSLTIEGETLPLETKDGSLIIHSATDDESIMVFHPISD